jgi:hypothetical protein
MLTSIVVFWVVTPCSLVDGYRRFGGTYCLYLLFSSLMIETISALETMITIYKIKCRNVATAGVEV